MKILLTGVCGFAGSEIAKALLAHLTDLKIIGLDNLSRKGSETNLEPLKQLGVEVRIGDIRNEPEINALPACDWVIDCAANPSVLAGVDGKTGPKELLDHNLLGTIHLLEFCRKNRAGFILLSTSRVYSISPLAELTTEVQDQAFRPLLTPYPDTLPTGTISPAGITESFPTEPPISLYGSSKKCSELLALEYGMTFEFPVWINRCGVLAGAGQFGKADQGIFSYWIHSWAAKRPLKFIGFGGKGYQVRDCLHPRDIVPLLVRQLSAPKNSNAPIVNIAGGTENSLSLAQLSHWCAERFGPHPTLSTSASAPTAAFENRPFDIPWLILDSSRAKKIWEWQPSVAIGTVLEEIAQHAEQNPKWSDLVN